MSSMQTMVSRDADSHCSRLPLSFLISETSVPGGHLQNPYQRLEIFGALNPLALYKKMSLLPVQSILASTLPFARHV